MFYYMKENDIRIKMKKKNKNDEIKLKQIK